MRVVAAVTALAVTSLLVSLAMRIDCPRGTDEVRVGHVLMGERCK